jgi:hypothetical protein
MIKLRTKITYENMLKTYLRLLVHFCHQNDFTDDQILESDIFKKCTETYRTIICNTNISYENLNNFVRTTKNNEYHILNHN